jgi:hypothetical protein
MCVVGNAFSLRSSSIYLLINQTVCIVSTQLRALESKVGRLVIQLNDELKEKTASLGLGLSEAQALPSCLGLLEEIEKTIDKRNAVHAAVELQEIDDGGHGDDDGAAPPPPAAAGM